MRSNTSSRIGAPLPYPRQSKARIASLPAFSARVKAGTASRIRTPPPLSGARDSATSVQTSQSKGSMSPRVRIPSSRAATARQNIEHQNDLYAGIPVTEAAADSLGGLHRCEQDDKRMGQDTVVFTSSSPRAKCSVASQMGASRRQTIARQTVTEMLEDDFALDIQVVGHRSDELSNQGISDKSTHETLVGAAAVAVSHVSKYQLERTQNIVVLTSAGDMVGEFVVEPTTTVAQLKMSLEDITKADIWHQELLHKGVILQDDIRWLDAFEAESIALTLVLTAPKALQDGTIQQAIESFCKGFEAKEEVERKYGRIWRWNTSNVTNMNKLFANKSTFDEDLSQWNVGNVTDMSEMFFGATVFTSDLNAWNVRNATSMCSMFCDACSFNSDLNAWKVSKIGDMSYTFKGAKAFNSDLNAWSVGEVTTMHNMFCNATSFNGSLSTWNVSKVADMEGMFRGVMSFSNDLNLWKVSNVTDMNSMFSLAASFNGDLSCWNVSSVTNMFSMFADATAFNGDLSAWNVSNVTNMGFMFFEAKSFNGDLSAWNVNSCRGTFRMFSGALIISQKKPKGLEDA